MSKIPELWGCQQADGKWTLGRHMCHLHVYRMCLKPALPKNELISRDDTENNVGDSLPGLIKDIGIKFVSVESTLRSLNSTITAVVPLLVDLKGRENFRNVRNSRKTP